MTIHWILQLVSLLLIQWIVIYPVNSAIHRLNNWGLVAEKQKKWPIRSGLWPQRLWLVWNQANRRTGLPAWNAKSWHWLRFAHRTNNQLPMAHNSLPTAAHSSLPTATSLQGILVKLQTNHKLWSVTLLQEVCTHELVPSKTISMVISGIALLSHIYRIYVEVKFIGLTNHTLS